MDPDWIEPRIESMVETVLTGVFLVSVLGNTNVAVCA